jgi:hypothetical protein
MEKHGTEKEMNRLDVPNKFDRKTAFIYVLSMISRWQPLVRHCWRNWKKDPLSRLLSPNDGYTQISFVK